MFAILVLSVILNPRTYTQMHTLTVAQECVCVGGGGVVDGAPPSLEFLICCSISKRFCLQWKAFDLCKKMRYILLSGGTAGGL